MQQYLNLYPDGCRGSNRSFRCNFGQDKNHGSSKAIYKSGVPHYIQANNTSEMQTADIKFITLVNFF